MKRGDNVKKFWAIKNDKSAMADIFIYGDIVSGEKWLDSDTTAKSFVDDLNALNNKPVTVHINSGGGDVFQALAIANTLKNYSGDVTISIEGICASAATLIACGSGGHVKAASNSVFMIHAPAVGLVGFYNGQDLTKIQNSMAAVEQSIITTYKNRVNESVNVTDMIQAETWLSASEAKTAGFIDEITDAVDMQIDDAKKLLFVNKLSVDIKNFDGEKLRRAMEVKNMEVKDEQGFFDKLQSAIANALKPAEQSKTETPVINAEEIRQQELSRIRDLAALKCDNAAVNAVIDVAIKDGKTVTDIQPYIDAVKKFPGTPTVEDTASKIVSVIKDQLSSGAEGVKGNQEPVTPEDVKKLHAQKIAEFANSMM